MKDFKDRLNDACNKSSDIPEYGKGRQVTIANMVGVSQEAVRKWLSGEGKPRSDTVKKLAKILDVEYIWLALGSDQDAVTSYRETSERQDAGLYAFVSFILNRGSAWAFNKDGSNTCDLTVIQNNDVFKYSVFSPINIRDDGSMEFQFTRQSDAVISVCACRRDGFDIAYNFVEVPEEVVAHHAQEGTPYVVKS